MIGLKRCVMHGILQWNITQSLKREWNNAACSNKEGPGNCDTKWSKSEKDKYHMISLMSVI